MTSLLKIGKTSVLNLLASVSRRAGIVIVYIALARIRSLEETGAFRIANTVTSLVFALSLFGLSHLFIRNISQHPQETSRQLSNYVLMRLAISVLFSAACALLNLFLPYSSETKWLILILICTIVPNNVSELYYSVWVAKENMSRITLTILIASLVRITGLLIAILSGQPLAFAAVVLVIISIAEMFAHISVTNRFIGSLFKWRHIERGYISTHFRQALPLFGLAVIFNLDFQLDTFILSLFRSEYEVGVYTLPLTIFTFLMFASSSIQLAVYPVLSRLFSYNVIDGISLYSKLLSGLLSGSIIVCVAIYFQAEWILKFIFNNENLLSISVLRIIVWGGVFAGSNAVTSRMMLIAKEEQKVAAFALVSLVTSIVLSGLLVPRYGALGSAWSRVMAMSVFSIGSLIYVSWRIIPDFKKASIAQ